MKAATGKKFPLLFFGLTLLALAFPSATHAQTAPQTGQPQPMLVFVGPEYYTTGGKEFTRYRYAIANFEKYPRDMFVAAPQLPPCGSNNRASRTWVDFYNQNGKRLYGFCALSSPKDLTGIWFALETDVVPPSWIYVEMTDRSTNTKYKSNLSETTQ